MLKCSTVDYSTFFSSIHLKIILLLGYGLYGYIVAVSFIGGGNRITRRKPLNFRKSLTNFIT
jgi:hypothetical protein